MQIKCEYCSNLFEDDLTVCPHCGAPNSHTKRAADGVPHTIDELKEYCRLRNVPLEKMHFHIGENYKGAKAYGIYKDGSNFVVYKNKADGSRAVRYSGTDEAYAVNEIFQKLRTEFNNHEEANLPGSRLPAKRKKHQPWPKWKKILLVVGIAFFVLFCIIFYLMSTDASGYYNYNGQHYYNQSNSWYRYDDSGWLPTDKPLEDMAEYYESYYYDYDYDFDDFSDSVWYDEDDDSSWSSWSDDNDWSSSWDDDDDWDYDDDWDWDSGSDWDSDW